jgi:hypothetical protein
MAKLSADKSDPSPSTESEMPVRPSREIKLFRMWICLRIEVGSREHGHDLVALSQPDTAEFDVFANKSRLGELHFPPAVVRSGSAVAIPSKGGMLSAQKDVNAATVSGL